MRALNLIVKVISSNSPKFFSPKCCFSHIPRTQKLSVLSPAVYCVTSATARVSGTVPQSRWCELPPTPLAVIDTAPTLGTIHTTPQELPNTTVKPNKNKNKTTKETNQPTVRKPGPGLQSSPLTRTLSLSFGNGNFGKQIHNYLKLRYLNSLFPLSNTHTSHLIQEGR